MHTMQVKIWSYMLQASENYNDSQEPTNKQNLEDISQYKLYDKISHLSNGVYKFQAKLCR